MLGRRKNKTKTEKRRGVQLTLHPLFFLVGVWYAFTGDLPLFIMNCLVALEHECAHAFAAAKLGYSLNKIVLMPFGAVIDGDLRTLSAKDEITIALCGPLCNLITAGFFVALWWCFPVTYAYTDSACLVSLAIALVNLLPAYPLDGGRILRCCLVRAFSKTGDHVRAERKAFVICCLITLCLSALFFLAFFLLLRRGKQNLSLCTFGIFLLVGALGRQGANYSRIDFSLGEGFLRGVEIKRVAVSVNCPIKNVFRFLQSGTYLVLEIYDDEQRLVFELPQNELSVRFATAPSPYATLGELYQKCI